jgi:hypothetical protein
VVDDLSFRRNLYGINESLRTKTLEGRTREENRSLTSEVKGASRSSTLEDRYQGGSESRELKLPKARSPESIVAIDLEGSYVSTDRGDLRSCVKGKKGR